MTSLLLVYCASDSRAHAKFPVILRFTVFPGSWVPGWHPRAATTEDLKIIPMIVSRSISLQMSSIPCWDITYHLCLHRFNVQIIKKYLPMCFSSMFPETYCLGQIAWITYLWPEPSLLVLTCRASSSAALAPYNHLPYPCHEHHCLHLDHPVGNPPPSPPSFNWPTQPLGTRKQLQHLLAKTSILKLTCFPPFTVSLIPAFYTYLITVNKSL